MEQKTKEKPNQQSQVTFRQAMASLAKGLREETQTQRVTELLRALTPPLG